MQAIYRNITKLLYVKWKLKEKKKKKRRKEKKRSEEKKVISRNELGNSGTPSLSFTTRPRGAQPRSQGSLLPTLRSEKERPWKMLVTCLPESWRLQTNDLGEGQASVGLVSTERRPVSAKRKEAKRKRLYPETNSGTSTYRA